MAAWCAVSGAPSRSHAPTAEKIGHAGTEPMMHIIGHSPSPGACGRQVETTPEQLAAASTEAEAQGAASGVTTRVIGWYHSHPRMIVLPSHVDVRTQARACAR